MSRTSKQLPLAMARGFEILLDTLPKQAVTDPERACQALQRYRLRPDNHLTAAFSELVEVLMGCIQADSLEEPDWEGISLQLKEQCGS
jgi:hypothetical protein